MSLYITEYQYILHLKKLNNPSHLRFLTLDSWFFRSDNKETPPHEKMEEFF